MSQKSKSMQAFPNQKSTNSIVLQDIEGTWSWRSGALELPLDKVAGAVYSKAGPVHNTWWIGCTTLEDASINIWYLLICFDIMCHSDADVCKYVSINIQNMIFDTFWYYVFDTDTPAADVCQNVSKRINKYQKHSVSKIVAQRPRIKKSSICWVSMGWCCHLLLSRCRRLPKCSKLTSNKRLRSCRIKTYQKISKTYTTYVTIWTERLHHK